MKKYLYTLLLGSLFFVPGTFFGLEEQVPCSHEILISFFPEPFVDNTFKKFEISDTKREVIVKELAGKNELIINTVEEKASKFDPNPLRDPKLRNEAVLIFRQTLMEVFSSVLRQNGINDPKLVQAMLDDIQQQKAKHFAYCMEKVSKPDKEQKKTEEDKTFKPDENK